MNALRLRYILFLFKKDFIENRRETLLSLTSMSIVLIIAGIFSILWNTSYTDTANDIATSYTFIFFIYGTCLASLPFKMLGSPSSAASYLLLPASRSEKFVMSVIKIFFIYVILFQLLATISLWASEIIVSLSAPNWKTESLSWPEIILDARTGSAFLKIGYFSAFAALQSFFFLGSLVWPNHSWIKTLCAIAAIIAIYILVAIGISEIFYNNNMYFPQPEWIYSRQIPIIVCVITTVVNYTAAFIRLREAETINRW